MNSKFIFKVFKREPLTVDRGERNVQSKPEASFGLKQFFLPKNNHWLRRAMLVFAFILFDYFSTLVFCHSTYEEANLYARAFMDSFGIQAGLTLFIILANLPIYVALSFDSHVVKLPSKIATVIEIAVDAAFAWFVAGLHFSGGTSWFWSVPDLPRQTFGAILYLIIAFLLVKPHKPCYGDS
jgi:hypothetical protein